MKRANAPFLMLPKDVASRTDLSMTAKLTYATITDAMRTKDFSFIGTRAIAKSIGGERRSVVRAILQLESAGLLVVERGKTGQRNTYRRPKSGDKMSPVWKSKSGDKMSPGGDKMSPEAVTKCHHKKTKTKEKTVAKPAAPAAAASHKPSGAEPERPEADIKACRAVLAQAGIGEPERSRLANHPEATVEILTKAVAGDGGAGLKVRRVREALDAAKAEREAEARHRARLDRERRERAADKCRDFRHVYFYPTLARLDLAAMDKAKRQRIWEEYLGQADGTDGTLRRIGWQRLAGDVLERAEPGRLQAIRDLALVVDS